MIEKDSEQEKYENQFVNHDKYDDVEQWANMPFEQFLHFLCSGREIEFNYNNKEYFIGYFPDGRILCYEGNDEDRYYDSHLKILEEKIDGRTLKDIFQNGDFTIGIIY